MNIAVKTYGTGRIYCRPDTTWERDNKDLFVPDTIKGYMFTPVLFARISKAGKCIGKKFSSRYYDSIGYGLLLYTANFMDNSPLAYATASCMDHTSILPFPMFNRVTLENGDNIFNIFKDGNIIYSTTEGTTELIEQSICDISTVVSVRIGDMIAIELDCPELLAERIADGKQIPTVISGTFCDNSLFDFKIVF